MIKRTKLVSVVRKTYSLIVSSEKINLGPRLSALLVLFVQSQGRVVSKKDILDVVWPNVLVSDDSVVQAISQLRRILGKHINSEFEFVETVRGVGYRFHIPSAMTFEIDGSSPQNNWFKLTWVYGIAAIALGILSVFGFMIFSGTNTEAINWTNFTASEGFEGSPVLSQDGTFVSFSRLDQNRDWQIYLQRTDQGTPVTQITTSSGFLRIPGFFSLQNDTLIYMQVSKENECNFFAWSALRQTTKQLASCASMYPSIASNSISPNATQNSVVYAADPVKRGYGDIYLTNLLTDKTQKLTDALSEGTTYSNPHFVNQDRSVAFVGNGSRGSKTILLKNIATGETQKIAAIEGDLVGFNVHGRNYYYSIIKKNWTELWSANFEGGEPFKISEFQGRGRRISLAHQPLVMAIDRYHLSMEILEFELPSSSNGVGTTLLHKRALVMAPEWQQETGDLFFIQAEQALGHLWVLYANDNTYRRVLVDNQYDISEVASAPSGNLIAVTYSDTYSSVKKIGLANANLDKLTSLDILGQNPSNPLWSDTGKALYYLSDIGGNRSIIQYDIASQTHSVIWDGPIRHIDLTDTGSVFFSDARTNELWEFSDGSSSCVTCSLGLDVLGDHWVVGENQLYYLSILVSGVSLNSLNLKTMAQSEIYSCTCASLFRGGSLAYDEPRRRLVLVVSTKVEGEIMVSGELQQRH